MWDWPNLSQTYALHIDPLYLTFVQSYLSIPLGVKKIKSGHDSVFDLKLSHWPWNLVNLTLSYDLYLELTLIKHMHCTSIIILNRCTDLFVHHTKGSNDNVFDLKLSMSQCLNVLFHNKDKYSKSGEHFLRFPKGYRLPQMLH